MFLVFGVFGDIWGTFSNRREEGLVEGGYDQAIHTRMVPQVAYNHT